MSQQLISRSPDLKRLRDDGYDLEIRGSYLLVKDVGHGGREQLAEDLIADHSFSSKPAGGVGYQDYYGKMVAYASILVSHAQAIDPNATAQTYPPIATEEHESVFKYLDTASSRAGINMASKKLEMGRVAIVGVGGTGSYVFDLVAKTPVKEIHLFDGDIFLSHNAFRSPGAASLEELRARPTKVAYLARQYSKMRGGIVEHSAYVDASNVSELQGMDFAFLCIDAGRPKKLIVEHLEFLGVPFIDIGMGVELLDSSLRGVLRVTASAPENRDHFRTRVSLADAGANEDYDTNIQVADLNALNASLAVIKWKKQCGFYLDFEGEYHSTYSIDSNTLTNDEHG